jgi:plastocyanin
MTQGWRTIGRMWRLLPKACVVGLMVLLAGCGTESGETSASVGPAETVPGAQLVVEGRTFGQVPSVAPGGSFSIVNRDAGAHTFTSTDGDWPQVDLPAGATVTFTAPSELAPGAHSFFCAFHPDSMGGRLTVTG